MVWFLGSKLLLTDIQDKNVVSLLHHGFKVHVQEECVILSTHEKTGSNYKGKDKSQFYYVHTVHIAVYSKKELYLMHECISSWSRG